MAKETSANIRRFLTRKCASLGIPVSGIFELTPRCNLQCKMCYVRLTPAQMAPIGQERSAQQWLGLAQEAKEAGMAFLLLTGGEPTLREDFPEIYEGLAQMGLSISINTNGTLFSPALRALWHRLPPAQVNVTLYGICREDYAALCGNPDAFDSVTHALDWLQEEGILVHLNTTIVPTNYSKWEKIEQFAKDRGLELRLTNYCFPPARRGSCDAFQEFTRLSPEDAGRLAAQDLYYREGLDAVKKRAAHMEQAIETECSLETGEPMQCSAARSQFWITWDGRMTPCGMLNQPVVRPFDDSFSASWSQLRQASSTIRLCPECSACEIQSTCQNCAAVTYTETGRFDGKPEYMCRMNQAYRSALQELSTQPPTAITQK